MKHRSIIEELNKNKYLSYTQWRDLFEDYDEEDCSFAQTLAQRITLERFGYNVYIRGIIEFSNVCKNDCLYCGIRCSNTHVKRYRLTQEEILMCCAEGYRLGFRTFVLQSGEDAFRESPRLPDLIRTIKQRWPDCAITLSLGECSREAYINMRTAGADRYLLRHETADPSHYAILHPTSMSFDNRLRCLRDLKEIGFQTGCGMMVGTPGQTPHTLAKDMELIFALQPAMVGIGPFLPHKDTPFAGMEAGSKDLTLFLLSLTRIMLPNVLLPATTALETQGTDGRICGILAGCNVIMPNLSPQNVKKDYMLYDNKSGTEMTAEESLNQIRQQLASIGRNAVVGRGDHKDYQKET